MKQALQMLGFERNDSGGFDGWLTPKIEVNVIFNPLTRLTEFGGHWRDDQCVGTICIVTRADLDLAGVMQVLGRILAQAEPPKC